MFGFHIRASCRSRLLVAGLASIVMAGLGGCGEEDIVRYEVPKETPPRVPPRMRAPQKQAQSGAQGQTSSHKSPLGYTVPKGWTEKSVSGMRAASFAAGEGEGLADVSVIRLVGTAGGMLANINRWRNQIGLAPVGDAELATLLQGIQVSGQPGKLLDIAGTGDGARRTVAAFAQRGGSSWFFKMTGPAEAVGAQKAAFLSFMQSVTLAGGR